MVNIKLNELNIAAVCDEADTYLEKRKTESKDRIRKKLSLTSILDFADTATNIYSGQCVLAVTSKSLDNKTVT